MNTNNSNKPGDDSKRRTAVSSSDKLYRDRTEIYALDPKQRVFGGIWDDDKSFAVPGGGIDPNETPEQAAVREFLEETGYTLKNPVLLPQHPVISEWSEAYRATKPDRAHYSGSRTMFVGGELGERMNVDKLDTWAAHRKKTYPLERAIKLMEIVNTPKGKELHKARLAVLTHLLEQRSKEAKDNAPVLQEAIKASKKKQLLLAHYGEQLPWEKQAVSVRWLANTLNRGLANRLARLSSRPQPTEASLFNLTDRLERWAAGALKRQSKELADRVAKSTAHTQHLGENPESLLSAAIKTLSGNPYARDLVKPDSPEALRRALGNFYRREYRTNRSLVSPRVRSGIYNAPKSRSTHLVDRKALLNRAGSYAKTVLDRLAGRTGAYLPDVNVINIGKTLPVTLHEAGHALDFNRRLAKLPRDHRYTLSNSSYGAEVLANRRATELLRHLTNTTHPNLNSLLTPKQYLNFANKTQLEGYRLASLQDMLKALPLRHHAYPSLKEELAAGYSPYRPLPKLRDTMPRMTSDAAPKPVRNLYTTFLDAFDAATLQEHAQNKLKSLKGLT